MNIQNSSRDPELFYERMEPRGEWERSTSGTIYEKLKGIAMKLGKELKIDGQGMIKEVFHMGDEKATLTKHLVDGHAGEEGGMIEMYVESWDYKRFPWWREALDEAQPNVVFLDTPISKFALDARIPNSENYFNPEKVVATYHLNPRKDPILEVARQGWVKEQIKEVLRPLLLPEFNIKEYDHELRLDPKSLLAIESRIQDNAAYEKAKEVMHLAVESLQKRYEAKQASVQKEIL